MTPTEPHPDVPPHLRNYENLYLRNPREASLAWFREAGLGLFMHYGVYALHARGEWGMLNQKMPIDEYEKLAGRFTAENFDTDFITDLALEAGAKYVNLTTKHHDGFCLWDTKVTDFHIMNTPAGRDLVGELAESCRTKGLGLFLYYSYGLDWHHPWFFSLEYFDKARPEYDEKPARYRFEKPEDFRRYVEDARAHLTELLTQYGPVAGVWFDPEMAYYAQPELFDIEETYAMIRRLQPHALIAFKHGATGTEDFAAPEGRGAPVLEKIRNRLGEDTAQRAIRAWKANEGKHGEICDTLSWSWGYHENNDSHHIGPDEVLEKLVEARRRDCNLLINTAPLADGSIPPQDVETLREVGRRVRTGELPVQARPGTFQSDDSGPAPIG